MPGTDIDWTFNNQQVGLGPLYDKARNVLSDTDLLGEITKYGYNAFGDQVSQSNPYGNPADAQSAFRRQLGLRQPRRHLQLPV